jgi:hypothetical protein
MRSQVMSGWIPCSLGIALAALALPAAAHHGISNWDQNKDVRITGVLSKFEMINPHSYIYVDVKGADGKVVTWGCEMRAAGVLLRSGWTRDMFKIGSTITVTGSPERRKPNLCYLGTITFADGSQMDRYAQRQVPASNAAPAARTARAARTPQGRPNLAGDWAAEQRVMTDPRGQSGAFLPLSQARKLAPGEVPEGQRAFPGARGTPESLATDPIKAAAVRPSVVPLTEAGQRAREKFNGATRDNPRYRCEPTNILFDWTFDTMVNRIVQTPEQITLQYGFMDLTRTIHLNTAQHPASLRPSVTGHSIGRWDGDVLVVDTTGFAPGVLSAEARTLHSNQLHVVERFELNAEKQTITRSYVATDPVYFAAEYKGTDTMSPAETPYSRYACKDVGGAPGE